MPNVFVNDEYLKATANAIRSKFGKSQTYFPSEMANAILSVPNGDSMKFGGIPTLPRFTQATWGQVATACKLSAAGQFDLTQWVHVGDVRTMNMSSPVLGTQNHLVEVVAINHDAPNTITFQTKNCLSNDTAWSGKDSYYNVSTLNDICESYYNACEAKAQIKKVKKMCPGSNTAPKFREEDYFVWMPSAAELNIPVNSGNYACGPEYTVGGKQSAYPKFSNSTSRIKKDAIGSVNAEYWTRSFHSANNNSRILITTAGNLERGGYAVAIKVCPMFVIG